MLSDSIFDSKQQLLKDIARYVKHSYGYDEDQIGEVMKALAKLAAIGIDYDAGGDGVPGEGSNLSPQVNFEPGTLEDMVHDDLWTELVWLITEDDA